MPWPESLKAALCYMFMKEVYYEEEEVYVPTYINSDIVEDEEEEVYVPNHLY